MKKISPQMARIRVAMAIGDRIERIRQEVNYFTNRPERILFDHLAKCGGSSISKFLARNFSPRVTLRPQFANARFTDAFAQCPREERYRIQLIIGHGAHRLIDWAHPDTIVCTILREPVDRLISHYYFALQQTGSPLNQAIAASHRSLEDFCCGNRERPIVNYYTSHFSGLPAHAVASDPEHAIGLAFTRIEKSYHIVGFQDQLAAFADQVAKVGNLRRRHENLVFNKTRKRLPIAELPARIREKTEVVHAADVELYRRLRAQYLR